MVPSHHPVHVGSCFSHGLANTESGADARDRRKRGKRRKKKMETLPATLPLSELECVQTHAGAGLPVMVALIVPCTARPTRIPPALAYSCPERRSASDRRSDA